MCNRVLTIGSIVYLYIYYNNGQRFYDEIDL